MGTDLAKAGFEPVEAIHRRNTVSLGANWTVGVPKAAMLRIFGGAPEEPYYQLFYNPLEKLVAIQLRSEAAENETLPRVGRPGPRVPGERRNRHFGGVQFNLRPLFIRYGLEYRKGPVSVKWNAKDRILYLDLNDVLITNERPEREVTEAGETDILD
jgi:hypothetical protein